jgi:phenylpropionate dioxygenase-like ring-hydroxylating dioxygenase large terminal subunit
MRYYASHEQARLDVNWKAVAEGLLDGLHVPFVHAETFGLNPQAANVDVSFVDRIGPHVRWGFPMFLPDDVPRLRALPDDELHAGMLGCVWLISPGLLLANELYGIIYADLTPGRALDEAYLRYGWLSPYDEGPEGMPSPEHMAARARKAVFEDQEVWEGCGRGLTLGAHDAELIGRNEYAIQLFHEGLAEQTGYPGLRRVGG